MPSVDDVCCVNQTMWIILNMRTPGSSGSPGPSAETYFRAREVYVGRTRA